MRWKSGRRSSNVEDRRGEGAAGAAGGAIAMRLLPALIRSKTGRWILLVGVIVFIGARFLGIDLMPLLTAAPPSASTSGPSRQFSATEQQLAEFVAVVLADTEDTWDELFKSLGETYQDPKLVLFSGRVQSACGAAQAAMGPFYCPADQKVYIDLSFYQDLKSRYGAPGDFAQAYVIAHEVGHHVQTLLGISAQVQERRARLSQAQGNQLSVRLELQADCFAGVWGYHAGKQRQLLESGDLEEALTAASAIGDDRLQQQSRGTVTPDSFTHGSSAQRVSWFRRGFESGAVSDCDTFSQNTI